MNKKTKYHFTQGEKVAHVDQLALPMYIDRLLYRNPIGEDASSQKQLIGIECYWFTAQHETRKMKFHSKLLIPWHIAQADAKTREAWMAENK